MSFKLKPIPDEEIFGAIQGIRAALDRATGRGQAMQIRDDIFAIHRAVFATGRGSDAARLVFDTFVEEAKAKIVREWGSVAWDTAETLAAALARMDAHPSPESPFNDPGRLLSDDELAAAEATVRAAIRWSDTGPASKVMDLFDLIMAELRRLRGGR